MVVYALAWNGAGFVWGGTEFVDYDPSTRASYATSLSEVGSTGTYHGTRPSATGEFALAYYKRVGDAPADADVLMAVETVGSADLVAIASQVQDLHDGKGSVGSVG